MPRGGKPKQYDSELVKKVESLYAENKTQTEIGLVLGLSQKVVWRLMLRHGIQARPAIKRNQTGRMNSSWKGDNAGYQALHIRVASQRGQPKTCQRCGTTDPHKTYEWANLIGEYTNPNDYERMCRSCHRRYDNERRKEVTPC